jgi:hypothetical protein
MRRCFYYQFCEAEEERGGSSLVLAPVFQALHSATFSGVPGFTFEQAADGNGGVFRFD